MQDASPRSDSAVSARSSNEDRRLSEPLLRRLQERFLVCLPIRLSNASSGPVVVIKPAPTPSSFDDPDTEETVLFESDRLVGATFMKAIQHITAAEHLAKEEMDALVLCYRTVSSPDNFLEMLILRYGSCAGRPHIQANVLVILKRWMRVAPSDFTSEDYKISEDLRDFLRPSKLHRVESQALLSVSLDLEATKRPSAENNWRVRLPNKLPRGFSLWEFTQQDVTAALTTIEIDLMKAVPIEELTNCAWNCKESEQLAPGFLALRAWGEQVRLWIVTEIIKGLSPGERARGLEQFIAVARIFRSSESNVTVLVQLCVEAGNFGTAGHIIAALNSAALARLERSWDVVSPKMKEQLDKVSDLFNPKGNFRNYRRHVKNSKSARHGHYIPFLTVILMDLNFTEVTQPDSLSSGLWNLDKARGVAHILKKFGRAVCKAEAALSSTLTAASPDLLLYVLSANKWDEAKQLEIVSEIEPSRGIARQPTLIAEFKPAGEVVACLKTHEQFHKILALSKVVTYKRNEVIVEEGGMNRYMYRLKTGEVRIEKKVTNTNGEVHVVVVDTLRPPQTFGELSLLSPSSVASAAVVAEDDGTELFEAKMTDVERLLDDDAELSVAFYRMIARRLGARLRDLPLPRPSGRKLTDDKVNKRQIEERKKQTQIMQRLGLPADEVLLRQVKGARPLGPSRRKVGTIMLFQRFLCFYNKTFGMETKEVFPLAVVKQVSQSKTNPCLITLESGNNTQIHVEVKVQTEANEFFAALLLRWKHQDVPVSRIEGSDKLGEVDRKSSMNDLSEKEVDNALSEKDWTVLLQGAKTLHFETDQLVLREGSHSQKIFQVISGACRVERGGVTLNVLREGEIFGELSFVDHAPVSASIYAHEDAAELAVLEGSYLWQLFTVQQELEGRFFRYVAGVLAQRLRAREKLLTFEDRKPALPSISLTKKYRKHKSGVIFYKSGSGWRKRFVEIAGGFIAVHIDSSQPMHSRKASNYLTPSDSNVSADQPPLSPRGESPHAKGNESPRKHKGSNSGKQLRRESTPAPDQGPQIRMLAALEGCTVVTAPLMPFCFKVGTGKWTRHFYTETQEEMLEWIGACSYWAEQGKYNTFESFAGVRENVGAEWYVDGCAGYEAIANAIDGAKETIFVADWWLIPEIYLRRKHPYSSANRFDKMLLKKAKEGVKIYVLVWQNTSIAIALNSGASKKKLESLHENIYVLRHPPLEPLNWSHHQKIVVVDSDKAFVGGLDVCYGRWDTPSHDLVDDCHINPMWPGQDYCNPRFAQYQSVEIPFKDVIERENVPRMPWHDVHLGLLGEAARDVALNFIQRWNHHKAVNGEDSYPFLHPKAADPTPLTGTCSVQVVRSICEWSGGNRTENSMLQAYLKVIDEAEHFIYIENQFFITSLAGGGVENTIGEALYKRIKQAIQAKATFRVIIVLPVHPDGTFEDSAAVRYIMKWQYDSICRGGNSILERLEAEYSADVVSNYISFNCLRNYGLLNNRAVTEQIYVHAKLLIVDDRLVICGSANINDRSMRGDRDSEIAAVIKDANQVDSKMNGAPYKAGKFAYELRRALFAEHLGLQPNDSRLVDPIFVSFWKDMWLGTASRNTALYSRFFLDIPRDGISTLDLFEVMRKKQGNQDTYPALKEGIVGHLIEFPRNFLSSENLKPGNLALLPVDRAVFQ